jgi:hypothetical protein
MDFGTFLVAEVAPALMLLAGIAIGLFPGYLVFKLISKRRTAPAYLKGQPIVVVTLKALDSVADVIGCYRGSEIYRYVVFKGMRYEYDRITPARARLRERELLMPPGVIYRTHD